MEGFFLDVYLKTSCSVSMKLFMENKCNINDLKSQCLPGLEFRNTNKSGDMADLLKKISRTACTFERWSSPSQNCCSW